MKPATRESLARRRLVFQITLHHDIAAEHHLAQHARGYLFHGLRIEHRQCLQPMIGHALARLLGGAAGRIQRVPFLMPFIDHGGAIDFGQAIDMHHFKARRLHRRQHCFGRRRRRDHEGDALGKAFAFLFAGAEQGGHHNRRAAQMGDAMRRQRVVDRARPHPTQADMGARHHRQAPGKTPAIAMKHGQGPQQHRMAWNVARQHIAVTHQRRAAMMADHALGIAGGARGIVQ